MTFTARFRGRCGVCDGPIAAGDECTYSAATDLDEDVVVHADCPEPVKPRPVCSWCFMEIPANGACECAA